METKRVHISMTEAQYQQLLKLRLKYEAATGLRISVSTAAQNAIAEAVEKYRKVAR